MGEIVYKDNGKKFNMMKIRELVDPENTSTNILKQDNTVDSLHNSRRR